MESGGKYGQSRKRCCLFSEQSFWNTECMTHTLPGLSDEVQICAFKELMVYEKRQRSKQSETKIFHSRGKLKEHRGEHMTLALPLVEDVTNELICKVSLEGVQKEKRNIQD